MLSKVEYSPYIYQTYCENLILEKSELGLFLDMGVGKTVITLSALEKLKFDRFLIDKILIVAPLLTAKNTWPTEIKKWQHLSLLTYTEVLGTKKERLKALQRNVDIYIINPENITWLVEHYKTKWPFTTVVIDELSVFKSHVAKRFRALKKVRPYIKRIVGLTGTPASNGLMDLWAEIFLLDQGKRLGTSITKYRDEYFVPDKRNATVIYSWKLKKGAGDRIQEKIKDLCISMRAKDYVELPDKIYIKHAIELSERSREQYKKLEKETFLPFEDGTIDGPTAAVLIQKLLQVAGGASYDDQGVTRTLNSDKLEFFQLLVEEAGDEPILVFYTYRHELERLQELYPEARTIKDIGAIEEWREGKLKMLLAHPKSAGHGLNLQSGGHIIIWYSLPLSLELYQQANARLARVGQDKPVLIHHILVEDTLDRWVLEDVLTPKEEKQNALLDAVKRKIGEVLAC